MTLFTLIIFLVSTWSLAFFANRTLQQDMLAVLGEQQLSTATLVAKEINHGLADRLQALEKVAAGIKRAALEDPAAIESNLDHRPVFQELFDGGVYVTRLDGVAFISVPRSAQRIGVSYLDRDYIANALKQGKASIGRPIRGRRILAPIVAIAAPIIDG